MFIFVITEFSPTVAYVEPQKNTVVPVGGPFIIMHLFHVIKLLGVFTWKIPLKMFFCFGIFHPVLSLRENFLASQHGLNTQVV